MKPTIRLCRTKCLSVKEAIENFPKENIDILMDSDFGIMTFNNDMQ